MVAFVTGGTKGIGLATALKLSRAGHHVVVGARNPNNELPSGIDFVRIDVADSQSIDAALSEVEEKHGAVDVLVANAGITGDALLMRMSDEEIDSVLQTNLSGSIKLARRVLRGMLKAKRGRIIFMSSVVGLMGSAGQVNYAASKSGLIGAARSLTREVGSRGITVNVVAPGFIETDMTTDLPEDTRLSILSSIPAGRYGSPEEVAHVIEFLASDMGSYISGAVIPVDGGLGMGH